MDTADVLELRSISKRFPVRGTTLFNRARREVHAVEDVTLRLRTGETLGLVGESGSGKSTVGRIATRLLKPTSGHVILEGIDVTDLTGTPLRALRRRIQMVFQDPYSSFDPSATVGHSVDEPLRVHSELSRRARRDRIAELMSLVGLRSELAERFPNELSGGQLQRIAIARALAVEPVAIVLDEPVSALDVSTQAQVLNLLEDLRSRLDVAYLFVAHDLAVVRHVSDRVAIMYLGRIMEEGSADDIFFRPAHPYTAALLSAIPVASRTRQRSRRHIALPGEMPSPLDPPVGCRFQSRCPFRMEVCAKAPPPPFRTLDGGITYCYLHTEGPKLGGASVKNLVTSDSASDKGV